MEYEIVNLKEKTLVSLKPMRISNNDPEVSAKISKLWEEFMKKSHEIENPKTKKQFALTRIMKTMKKVFMMFQ